MADPNKFKNNFRPEKNLPKDFSWENTEEGIYEIMETQKASSSKLKKLKSFVVGILGISVLALLLCFALYNNTTNEQSLSNITTHESKQNNEQFEGADNSNVQQTKQILKASETKLKTEKRVTTESNIEQKKKLLNQTKASSDLETQNKSREIFKQNIKKTAVQKTEISKRIDKQKIIKEKAVTNQKNNPISSEGKLFVNQSAAKQLNKPNPKPVEFNSNLKKDIAVEKTLKANNITKSTNTQSLHMEPVQSIELISLEKIAMNTRRPDLSNKEITLVKKSISKWSILAEQAIGLTNISYAGDSYSAEKNQNESGLLSSSTMMGIAYKLNRSWSIKSGIHYDQHYTKLDFYFTNDTIVNKDVVTQQYINPLNGDTTKLIENKAVDGESWRHIVHYNTYKNISVPIIVSKAWGANSKIKLNTDIGVLLGISGGATGKIINEDKTESSLYLVNDLQDGTHYQYQSNVAVLLGANINMPLSNNLEFGLGIKAHQSITDLSAAPNEKMNLRFTGINLNLAYKL